MRIAPCEFALAIREAIASRVRSQWLVVLTDRPDDDLGAGILSHLIGNRLRTPDPWEAVRSSATADAAERLCLPDMGERALAGLKFSEALPERLAQATLAARLADLDSATTVLRETVRFTTTGKPPG